MQGAVWTGCTRIAKERRADQCSCRIATSREEPDERSPPQRVSECRLCIPSEHTEMCMAAARIKKSNCLQAMSTDFLNARDAAAVAS